IPGHDVGEARSEWEMLLQLARAVNPRDFERVRFDSGAQIRADIARAVPAYAGIERLETQGDQFQIGGARLCENRVFPTADGRAHFQPVAPPAERSETATRARFLLATRRGKQFNSMVQRETDPLTGASRDHVFIAPVDAEALGLAMNDPVVLSNETGEFRGRAFIADVAPGTLQGHWPEVNVLIAPGIVAADGGVPDYNATVTVQRELVRGGGGP